jgi:DNA-binding response OmpR family regulator
MSQNRKLLIVDDEAVVCDTCVRILAPQGFEVEFSTDARQGLQQAIEKDFAGILLDLKMPELDGLQFLEALRRVKPRVPVLIMTGYASVESAAAAVRLGVSDYITKPFAPDEIVPAVRRMLERDAAAKPESDQTATGYQPPPAPAGERLLGEPRLHVVVCVKMVPDTTQVQIDPVTNTLVRKDVPFITNPFDTRAVEESLRVKDRYEAHVTAISMGPPAAEAVLRRALSLGVDEAVLLSDMAFGGADTLATSKVLAQAIRRLDQHRAVDLIICGQQTGRHKGVSLALAPGGNLAAAASADGVIRLWNIKTYQLEATLPTHVGVGWGTAFSHDGRLLASAGADGYVVLWDVFSRKQLRRWRAHDGEAVSVAFSPDDKHLASGGDDLVVNIGDLASQGPPH